MHKYNTGKHLSPLGTSRPKRGVVLVQSQPATKKPTASVAPPTSSSKDTRTYYPSLSPHTQSTTALPLLTPPATSSIPLLTVPLNPAIPVVPPANSQFLSPVKSSTLSNPRAGVSSDQTVVADGRSPRKKRFVLLAYTSCALS